MTALAKIRPQPEDLSCVALLETPKGAELHLHSRTGRVLRLPLASAERGLGIAALAMMAGVLEGMPA